MNSREASIISSFLGETKWGVKGQYFLMNRSVREELVKAVEEFNPELIIEVGPGLGFITEEIIKLGRQVIGVELDKKLCMILKRRITAKNLDLVNADVLTIIFPENSVIAGTPPYYISSDLLTKCVVSKVLGAVLILQKEFVNRLLASIGTKNYSYITCLLNTFGRIKIIREVDRSSFFPRPNVDSVLLKIVLNKHCELNRTVRERYLKFLTHAFKEYRNKRLKELLKGYRIKSLGYVDGRLDLNERILNLDGERMLSIFKAVESL